MTPISQHHMVSYKVPLPNTIPYMKGELLYGHLCRLALSNGYVSVRRFLHDIVEVDRMELAKIINRLMVSKRNGNKDADQLVVKAIEKVTHATKPNVHSKSKMPENDTQSIRLDFVSSTDDPLGGRKHA